MPAHLSKALALTFTLLLAGRDLLPVGEPWLG